MLPLWLLFACVVRTLYPEIPKKSREIINKFCNIQINGVFRLIEAFFSSVVFLVDRPPKNVIQAILESLFFIRA